MIAVTAASGKLGRLVLEALLGKVPASSIVAIARSPEKLADFAARGVTVRAGDYSAPATLAPALAGAKRVLLISGTDFGQRVEQHGAVIAAAKAAGAELVAYTSILHADTTKLVLAPEHKGTEDVLRASGVPFTFLRNSWYIENYTENLAPALAAGAFIGSSGSGLISAATRADFAAAAAQVLTTDGHAGKAYELAGDVPFTRADFAAAVSKWAGRELPYRDLSSKEFEQALVSGGMPAHFAALYAAIDEGILAGELDTPSRDLHQLIGRATTTVEQVLATLPKP